MKPNTLVKLTRTNGENDSNTSEHKRDWDRGGGGEATRKQWLGVRRGASSEAMEQGIPYVYKPHHACELIERLAIDASNDGRESLRLELGREALIEQGCVSRHRYPTRCS